METLVANKANWTIVDSLDVWGFTLRVLHKHLRLRMQGREARAWVKAEVRGHRPALQGPKGMSTP